MTADSHDLPRNDTVAEILPATAAPLAVRPVGDGEVLTLQPAATFRWTKRRFNILIGLGACVLLLGVATWYWWASNIEPVHYKTASVDRGPITSVVTATGTVNPVVSVQVGSQVSGKIAKLFADFNSTVKEGQVLAKIDQQPFNAKVSQARAAVKNAHGNLEKSRNMMAQRKLERDRMAVLRPQAFVSQADLDLAETNYRDAAAQTEVAQAQLDQAEASLASAELMVVHASIIMRPMIAIAIRISISVRPA